MGHIRRFWELPVSMGCVGMSQMEELLRPGSAVHNRRGWPNLLPSPCPTCPVTAQNTSWAQYSVRVLCMPCPWPLLLFMPGTLGLLF